MTALWTSAEAVAATGGNTASDWTASGVSIDTRSLNPGDLFVALKDSRDGHDFVAPALAQGASAALVSRVPDGVDASAPLLIVDDVLCALVALGVAARSRARAQVVAVAGSVGKTSTKDMLRAIFSGQGRVHAAESSYNNHWGVPLTLARLPRDADFAVLEIGMNHPGEIAPLAAMVRAHVALITTIAPAHLQAFDDIQGIAREKAAIFGGLVSGGVAVINADLPQPLTTILLDSAAKAGARVVRFGQHRDADFRLTQVQLAGDTTVVHAMNGEAPLLFKVMAAGRHLAMNALGALAAAKALGVAVDMAARDLATWAPPAGRGTKETIVLDVVDDHLTLSLLDDAYNANPASVAAALAVLAASQPRDGVGRVARGRRIAVLGDMLELGQGEHQMHADIARLSALDSIDVVHCVGPRMQALHDALPRERRGEWRRDAPDMASDIHRFVDAGDVILVKGSLGSKVSLVVDAIRKLGHPLAPNMKGSK